MADRKMVAVIDGKQVFSCEVLWEPKLHGDPQYHFYGISIHLREVSCRVGQSVAAASLPRLSARGSS